MLRKIHVFRDVTYRWFIDSRRFEGPYCILLQGLEDEGNVGNYFTNPDTKGYVIENLNFLSSNWFLQKTTLQCAYKSTQVTEHRP